MTQIIRKTLFYILILYVFPSTYSQVGNKCNLPIRGKGVCKKVSDCPKAAIQAKVGIPPVSCGRQNNVPIVCCEGTTVPTVPTVTNPPAVLQKNFQPSGNLRKCQQKCIEYSQSVQTVEIAAPLSAKSSLVPSVTSNCRFEGLPLIYGGEEAGLGEFPHMALLGFGNPPRWQCGGSLISDQYVLTAAHCLHSRDFGDVSTVRLGELNIAASEPDSQPEDFTIAEAIQHTGYSRPLVYNDIALLKLSRRVQFDTYKRPACLWHKFDIGQNTTTATGWGTTENNTGSINDALLKVGLDILDNNACNNTYENYFGRKFRGTRNSIICARNVTRLGDTCGGDSGGPIQIINPNNRCIFYVIGVTAAGHGCGSNLPTLYTRVSEYIDWIENIVWP